MVPVTSVFIAVFALIQIPLTFQVGLYRREAKIRLLDNGDETLTKKMRAHGNFTEIVPIALLCLAAAESLQAPLMLLIFAGLVLLASRLLHMYIVLKHGWSPQRAIAMLGSFLSMFICAAYILWISIIM